MVKIVSRKSLGKQPVYDLGVVEDHNFLLGNGLVASNCFNKSHSTAYAYVTYQTAYLKANYPVEYMSALLTASSGDRDKVEKYRENCQRMGIEVEPPDINRSEENFTPQGNNILFGLSAVKNLGQGAIDTILQARSAAGGKFNSLADFCQRIDLRVVNRRALETLIYCGAFDKIEPNRRQLIDNLEVVIPWAQAKAKEKEIGQLNLFDLMGNGASADNSSNNSQTFEQAPSAPKIEDYPLKEKLNLEKEHLGFYVSDHPLKAVQNSAQILSPINLSQLSEQKSRQKVCAIVMLNAVRTITTQKGDRMAFLQMEDVTGEAEGTVFPDTYEQMSNLLKETNHLIVWGKAQARNDRYQLIIEDAELIDRVKIIFLEINSEQASNPNLINKLKGILQEHSGESHKLKIPVIVIICHDRQRQFIRLGQKFWVQDESGALISLKNAGFSVYEQALVPS